MASSASGTSTSSWVQFFVAAGIPRSASAQYADAFSQNRIGMDMLMDLNKEYLRDMGIVVLGDIIAILKQAKSVQGKLTTEKVYRSTHAAADNEDELTRPQPRSQVAIPPLPKPVPTAPQAQPVKMRAVPPPAAPPQVVRTVSAGTTAAVSSRLGPPAQRTFAELGLTRKQQQATTAPTSMAPIGRGVFARLGGHSGEGEVIEEERTISMRAVTGPSTAKREILAPKPSKIVRLNPTPAGRANLESKSAFQRLGTVQASLSLTQGQSRIKAPPSSTTAFVPGRSAVVSGLVNTSNQPLPGISDRLHSRSAAGSQGIFATEKSVQKKKSFILVKTLKDGTKISQKLQPDDPILKKLKVTRRETPPPPPSDRPFSKLGGRVSLQQSTRVTSSSGRGSDMSTREPRKRPRITGPDDDSDTDRTSPVSRKRTSAPMDGGFEVSARKHLRLSERLGPRQSF